MTVELDDDRFCPTCDRPMVERTVSKGVRVDVCEESGRVFFDDRELRAYRSAQGLRSEIGRLTRRRSRWTGELTHCPRCDTLSLRKGWRGQVEIAHCVECRGFLFPSLEAARSTKLMAYSPAAAPGHLRRIAPFAFILAAVILGLLALLGATS